MDSPNSTEALARRLGIESQSIRARVCRTGSYFGERPVKLPNGRLWWPDGTFERLAFGSKHPQAVVANKPVESNRVPAI